jgi:DNA-binding response OmpR family regulator
MQAKVLVIEDDAEIAELIQLYLRREGIDIHHASSAEEGSDLLRADEQFQLVLLDLNLPGMDGYEFLQAFRKKWNIPVIIVSARIDDADMILGFGYGADDFVQKPFSPKVLAARVRAHLRRERRSQQEDRGRIIQFGPYRFAAEDQILKKDGERVNLSPKEVSILSALCDHEGKPVSQNDLYEEVWGNKYGDLTTVSVHMQRLRRKIEEDPANPRYLTTIYGFGYMFTRGDTSESV